MWHAPELRAACVCHSFPISMLSNCHCTNVAYSVDVCGGGTDVRGTALSAHIYSRKTRDTRYVPPLALTLSLTKQTALLKCNLEHCAWRPRTVFSAVIEDVLRRASARWILRRNGWGGRRCARAHGHGPSPCTAAEIVHASIASATLCTAPA